MALTMVTKLRASKQEGFSLVEVLAGVMIFSFGMLGVAALLTATVRDNSFSGNLTEANLLVANKVDELLGKADDYDTDADLQDTDGDALAGIADIDTPDRSQMGVGKNDNFNVYWNVADDQPVANIKTINVIVQWGERDSTKQINFRVFIAQENT